ncbi:hypothetical protein SLS62_000159 [Diatrype stigma]|uniref:G-protein coupled receptors family 1 profile domain-containing protein n=1 Tax=Diatrype stigma TaxID=117547 RepID=A0AAN9V1D9_9PEZI
MVASNSNNGGAPAKYYEEPFTLEDMDDEIHGGLLAIGTLATISVIFTSMLLSFITWRMIKWKSYYASFVGRNQCVVLIYQLILADLLQALGFIISFHWASGRAIRGPDSVCFAQGWLIQLGDVASGFFVMAIALHTCRQVATMTSRSSSSSSSGAALRSTSPIRHRHFLAGICGIWAFSLLLTALAPILGGRYVFLRAGSWCWISEEHDDYRLGLHYLWIFIVQFGSIFVYTAGFYSIYRSKYSRKLSANNANGGRGAGATVQGGASSRVLRRAASSMLAYACAYTVLTLPLAAGRMATMSHRNLSPRFYLIAGCLFTSSGWVDALLYTLTRRSLLFQELDPQSNHINVRRNDNNNRSHHRGSQGGYPSSPGLHHYHASSTDSILREANKVGTSSGGGGGIKVDRTVNVVVLDDLESNSSSELEEGKGIMDGRSPSRTSRSRGVGSAARITAEPAHATRTFGL